MEGNKTIVIRTLYGDIMNVVMSSAYYRGERLKESNHSLAKVQVSSDDERILQDLMLTAENEVVAVFSRTIGRVVDVTRNAVESITIDGVVYNREPSKDNGNLLAWGDDFFTKTEAPTIGTLVYDKNGTLSGDEIENIPQSKGTAIRIMAMNNFASELPLRAAVGDYIAERVLAGWLEAIYPEDAANVFARASEKMAVVSRICIEREKPKRESLFK